VVTPLRLEQAVLDRLKCRIIVNATPVGMFPQVDASPWPPEAPLPAGAFLYDLIYNPPETALMKAARQAGLETASGLGMLIEQAALALERWTGQRVPRRVMWQAVAEGSLSSWQVIKEGLPDRLDNW
jgi:shikimate dehydrogenase